MKEQLSPLPNPENKRINFELDVEGIKIPCWKEDILYPKDIQKETQMEGYEKIRVRWDDFFTFMQKDLGITETIDESDLYKKFSKLLTTAKEKDLKQEAGIEIYEYDIEKKLMEKFLGSFSGGRYPKAMYVHSLYGDHEYPIAEDGSDIHKEFLQDGMFLGKIDSIPIRSVSGSWLFSNVRTPKLIINEKNEVEFFGQLLQEPTGKITGMKYGGPTDSKFADNKAPEVFLEYPSSKNHLFGLFGQIGVKNIFWDKVILDVQIDAGYFFGQGEDYYTDTNTEEFSPYVLSLTSDIMYYTVYNTKAFFFLAPSVNIGYLIF